MRHGQIFFHYRTQPTTLRINATHFDIQVSPDEVWITGFRIAPDKSGQGHGRKLLECVEDICREVGHHVVNVNPSGDKTKSFYRHMGFQEREQNRFTKVL